MFAPSKIKVGARAVALALGLATTSFSAHAVLERVGPVSNDPTIGGFPAWYQDTTGIALDFCAPTQAEMNGGWCLLLPGDAFPPEVFPTNFFDEHFYYAATAIIPSATAGNALLVIAVESAFAVGPAIPGDQVTFSRIRVRMNAPVSGTYRFIHPYGEEVQEGLAGQRIFFTEDIGIGAPGDFTAAMNSRLGPFLIPSATPGGAEMPPVTEQNPTPDTDPAHFGGVFAPTPFPGTLTGKAYIADPSRIGPITGSTLPNFIDSNGASRNHNIFRIEGPAGSALGVDPVTGATVDWIETTDFSLMGRLFNGAMPGKLDVGRASYTRNVNRQKLDVLATGEAATAARYPAQAAAGTVPPTATYFEAPCVGTTDAAGNIRPPYSAPVGALEIQMIALDGQYWGQSYPAIIPSAVCVKNGNARDALGNLVPVYSPMPVTDEVTISQAAYDPSLGTLTVAATSSDTAIPPALQLSYGSFIGNMVGGAITVPNVFAPPAKVSVLSSARGVTEFAVTTGFPGAPAAGAPVAVGDSFTFAEDSGLQILPILANDTNAFGGTVTLTSLPSFGTALVNPDGTVSYTPRVNANGADSFTYTVTVGAQVSATATVGLNITPVNDAPVAVNDAVTTSVNVPVTVNVLGNDTDPDGVADLFAATAISASSPAGATITGGAGGLVTFTAAVAGTYTFTYRAQDTSLVTSANTGRVTVTVNAPEAIAINKNQYTASTRNLAVEGTITPAANSTVTVSFTNNAGTVLGLGGTTVATAGKFKLSATVAGGLPVGATRILATTPAGAATSAALVIK